MAGRLRAVCLRELDTEADGDGDLSQAATISSTFPQGSHGLRAKSTSRRNAGFEVHENDDPCRLVVSEIGQY